MNILVNIYKGSKAQAKNINKWYWNWIESMGNAGEDVIIIFPKAWAECWPLQEVNIQFQRVGTLSLKKWRTRWLKCTEPKGQISN